jgi:hypothetical protein
MARTTAVLVKALLAPGKDYDLRSEPSLDPFIDTAALLVDDIVECATARGVVLTDARLELIERWMAAHFYKQSDQAETSRSTGGASASFQGQTGLYLDGTKYGQTAKLLDTSGCLATIAGATGRQSARGFWAGKPPSTQTDYIDRD